ncbi:hypothetical protein L3081_07345 [Colwellia sp. MSW7]|uniref:Prokaryotic glutathione synthetase ATP-binding domain-containing protein n=1 Tax=Colwellia maritima TaxID=2912588 RepID=A0ABS9WZ90_9GAMM|nr:hypothetical protein [Colwellia maritima]MCI2283246.1 hypothetical protein [Colwellia maritima]
MKHCAILTMDNLSDFECYDYLLDEPLAELGWATELISWRAEKVNWDAYDAVIIRSPWDYQDDASAFILSLEQIDNSSARLQNSLSTVCWNIDKIYLKSVAEQGGRIVPTLWHENFSKHDIPEFFDYFSCQQLVIKPRISANADNTFWLKKETAMQFAHQLESVFSQSEFMVQPFINSVIDEGEFSLFYFDGVYSHAILKTPKQDDFRVQEEHGGYLQTVTPEKALLTQADDTLAVITRLTGDMPLYARLDFVRLKNDDNNNKGFALMEAELIEPSLYFNMDDKAAEALC